MIGEIDTREYEYIRKRISAGNERNLDCDRLRDLMSVLNCGGWLKVLMCILISTCVLISTSRESNKASEFKSSDIVECYEEAGVHKTVDTYELDSLLFPGTKRSPE